jgi:RNA 2',3'-cyclic 3'-phosphodiesterase
MRIFFALWPPVETARALARWTLDAQRQSGGSPTHESKIHLTLAFLGEADAQRAVSAARRVAADTHDLPIEQARYWRENRIVWAGPRETPPALKALFESLSMELYREQFILERRPFAAHVDWPVREFLLVRSSLSPKGSTYEPLERFALR